MTFGLATMSHSLMLTLPIVHEKYCNYALAFKGLTPRTIQGYREVFRYFLQSVPVTKLHEVNQFMIEDWLMKGKLEKDWSAKTIRNRLLPLEAFLSGAENAN